MHRVLSPLAAAMALAMLSSNALALTPTPIPPTRAPVTYVPTGPGGFYANCTINVYSISLKPLDPSLLPPTPVPIATPTPTLTPGVTPTPRPSPTPTPTPWFTPTPNPYVTPTPAIPVWSAEQAYTTGQIISYQGTQYRARWWTQGDIPQTGGWGPWELISTAGVPYWSAQQTYVAGQEASHQGKIYRARWWTSGEAPGAEWGVWEFLRVDDRVGMSKVVIQGTITQEYCWRNDWQQPYHDYFYEKRHYDWQVVADPDQVVAGIEVTDHNGSLVTRVPSATQYESSAAAGYWMNHKRTYTEGAGTTLSLCGVGGSCRRFTPEL
ncbi:carbohydrate-binding protein [Chitinolyticbacter albus]|uniref:carbohydrate-binding protein n=1 Tax=Chitinolyticbacter albus TaxID=2961951 RepID=UPI00210CA0A2|nr:carbohydrate-binding protein [Chitinolyticbacter albus]